MINFFDIAYGLGVGVSSPFWLLRPRARRKVLSAFAQRMGHVPTRDRSVARGQTAVMIHAVSLGELNATRTLIDRLRVLRPGLQFTISTTTDTGWARGLELYGTSPDVTLVRFPLDFSPAIHRLLDAQRPSVVALMELEVWPNFIHRCAQRHIPVILINGRVTPHSFPKYRMARPFIGSMFAQLHDVCVQEQIYVDRFIQMGARPDRVHVTGTMKFDTAAPDEMPAGCDQLAAEMNLHPGKEPIWVCGSTGPGEEDILLPIYRRLLAKFPKLRLVIVPRKPERFEEVAKKIIDAGFPLHRRSNPHSAAPKEDVILGDTMGELRKFYALADVVFVGRTLVDLGPRQHGSDMIEPAALARPVIVGTFTANFAEVMNQFLAPNAMLVASSPADLESHLARLLSDPAESARLGTAAQTVVRQQRGATERHAQAILAALQTAS